MRRMKAHPRLRGRGLASLWGHQKGTGGFLLLQDQPRISKSVPTFTPLYPRVSEARWPPLSAKNLSVCCLASDLMLLPSLGHKVLRSCLGHPLHAWWPSGELEPRLLHTADLLSCGWVASHPVHGIRGLLGQTAWHREAIPLLNIPRQTFSCFPICKRGSQKTSQRQWTDISTLGIPVLTIR